MKPFLKTLDLSDMMENQLLESLRPFKSKNSYLYFMDPLEMKNQEVLPARSIDLWMHSIQRIMVSRVTMDKLIVVVTGVCKFYIFQMNYHLKTFSNSIKKTTNMAGCILIFHKKVPKNWRILSLLRVHPLNLQLQLKRKMR